MHNIHEIGRNIKYIVTNFISDENQKRLAEVMASNDKQELYESFLKWIKNEFLNIDENRKKYIFAFYDNIIIGFIRIWNSEYCNKCYNDGMDVKREYQNIGIGYNLLKMGILEAKKLKIKGLYANINGNNISSIKIHEKCKFKKIGLTKINSYGENVEDKNLFEYKLDIKDNL
jgi:predicted acetyltransferase